MYGQSHLGEVNTYIEALQEEGLELGHVTGEVVRGDVQDVLSKQRHQPHNTHLKQFVCINAFVL